MNKATQDLVNYGIRPSVQRSLIYGYLLEHRTHPTVDEIYEALCTEIPTLSKTTIYNTLALFAEKGAVLVLTFDGKTQHFDAYTNRHAHFVCQCCGKITDLPYPNVELEEMDEGFVLHQTEVTHKGICPEFNSLNNQHIL